MSKPKSIWHSKMSELTEEQREIKKAYHREKWLQRKERLGDEAIKNMVARDRLRKYGITPSDVDSMRSRQNNKCLITQEEFTKTPCVDHDHKTGKVRGLLSREANMVLGLMKENPESFYRAVAYLTLDRTKPFVYVIGSLRNKLIPEVANRLREEGLDAFDNWFSAGEKADDSWQSYSRQKGLSFTEALQSREANHVFRFDRAYLDLCDAAVLVMPAGKSGFLELGYVLGAGKPAYILLDEETENNRYDVMPQFASVITSDVDYLVGIMKEEMEKYFG